MSALLSEKKEGLKSEKIQPRSNATPVLAGFAFLLGLLPCLFHNLLFCESRIMLATDGKHFLHTVGLLVEYFKLSGPAELTQKFLLDSQLAGHILFDGPLMSLIYSPLFLLLNKVPGPRDWMTLALGQSFFHAVSTVLLTVIVRRLTRSNLFAVMAAIVYGLYPPAVLQSGHFMSELPVSTLLLTLFLCISSGTYVIAGITGALLILSKPALIPAVVLLSLSGIVFYGRSAGGSPAPTSVPFQGLLTWTRKRLKPIAGITAGLFVILGCWSVFCYKSTGNIFPTAQRQPLYNVVSGWNYEADGWAHNPHPPLTEMFTDADGPLPSAAGIWMSHPEESLRLALSKVSRLLACPWNDFKGRALGLDENAQILIHKLILACAAFGASIYLFCSRRYLDSEQRKIILMSAILFVCHFSYLMVECQPRYTFTAMPFAVILAIYGIWQVSRLSFQDPRRRISIAGSVALALASTGLLLHAENFSQMFEPRSFKERTHILNKQDSAEKYIDFSSVKTPAAVKSVLVLVDGDKNLEKGTVEVNGVRLSGALLPTMHFDAEHYRLYDQLREFGPAMRISVGDFRQWRAIPVDARLINWTGKNHIVIKSLVKDGTIYGDRRKTRYCLSPDFCNYGVLAASSLAAGAESRYRDPILTADSPEASALRSKGEKARGIIDSLRIRLLVNLDTAGHVSCSGSGPVRVEPCSTYSAVHGSVVKTTVSREPFDRILWHNDSADCLHINKVSLYAARTVAANIPLPVSEPGGTHIKLKITGELKALKNAGDVGLLCAVKGKNGAVQILGKTPRALSASEKWGKFQIDDLLPLSLFGGEAESIELALYPCPWMEGQYGVSRRATDALFRNIVVESSKSNLPELSRQRIIY